MYQITKDAVDKAVYFKRYARRNFGLNVDIDVEDLQVPESRTFLAFTTTFMPAWNSDLLGLYFTTTDTFEHGGIEYTQYWDDSMDKFYFVSGETNESSWVNPVRKDKQAAKALEKFRLFDVDNSERLNEEVKSLLEDEMCIVISENDLTNAMNLMDADGNGHVTEDEFLVCTLAALIQMKG